MTTSERLLTTAEAAALLGIAPQSLRAWRHYGRGPRFVRFGGPRGRAAYRPEDLRAWIEARTAVSTTEESTRAATGV
jgi:predicted DNA-binding transcriptional regulator AlpA